MDKIYPLVDQGYTQVTLIKWGPLVDQGYTHAISIKVKHSHSKSTKTIQTTIK
jgi:hypothetical protein